MHISTVIGRIYKAIKSLKSRGCSPLWGGGYVDLEKNKDIYTDPQENAKKQRSMI